MSDDRVSEVRAQSMYRSAVDECRRSVVANALRVSGWNVSAAARLLGVQRTYVNQLRRRLGIEREVKP